jgi:hypothetical protein
VAAAVSTTSVKLTWTDNSSNEDGFKVERSTDGTTFTQVTQTSANVTTFVDTGLTPGATYTYRVRATNSVGDSGYSNTASVTTPLNAAGLAAEWAFDEGSGTVAHDSAGSDQASLVGASWAAGRNGTTAVAFGGGSAHVVAPDEPALHFTAAQSYTLSAWVSPGALTGGWEGVVTKGRDVGNWTGIWIAGGQWVAGSLAGNIMGPAVTAGWHLVTIVQDGSAGTRTLYVDGVASATGGAGSADNTGSLWVGGAAGVSEVFVGTVDDVRVYSRALSTAEVQTLYTTT